MNPNYINESSRETTVTGTFDLCVLGGSCTGLFAAVRAARLGLSVAIVEKMGCFGGVATLSLVNVWHTPLDEIFEQRIFAGLTQEVIDRLKKRNAVKEDLKNHSVAWIFQSAEMQIELDQLIQENHIQPYLHTSFVSPVIEEERLTGILIENKSGRQAIRAKVFIDATGDGDLCHRSNLHTYVAEKMQPSTTCALFSGWETLGNHDWGEVLREHGKEFDLPEGFAWGGMIPSSNMYMLAGTRVYDDCSTAEGFTRAEMEGRRQVRAIHDILQKYIPESNLVLQSLPARIGIRETRHVSCLHQLTGEEVQEGAKFEDAITYGSYRVDIHHTDKPGITLQYLNGEEVYQRPGHQPVRGRWRPEQECDPTYYQIPYRCLIPKSPYGNLLVAGRCIDADSVAHGAIRVMVNMNQTGEAAGVAASLMLKNNQIASEVDPRELRNELLAGGSVFPE